MAESDGVHVTTNLERGVVLLNFGEPVEACAVRPEGVPTLIAALTAAVEELKAAKRAADRADSELEELVSDLIDELNHEEKEAHGGD